MQYNDDHANGDENDNVRGSRRHGRAARIYAEDHGHVHDGGEEGPLRVVTGQAEQLLFKAESREEETGWGERETMKQEESPSGLDGTRLPRVDRRIDASGRSRRDPREGFDASSGVERRRVLDSHTPVGRAAEARGQSSDVQCPFLGRPTDGRPRPPGLHQACTMIFNYHALSWPTLRICLPFRSAQLPYTLCVLQISRDINRR